MCMNMQPTNASKSYVSQTILRFSGQEFCSIYYKTRHPGLGQQVTVEAFTKAVTLASMRNYEQSN